MLADVNRAHRADYRGQGMQTYCVGYEQGAAQDSVRERMQAHL